jgi:hypothetical protein
VNGVQVGEAVFDGKRRTSCAERAGVAAREGTNELRCVNVGDTGVYSLVFLDRFEVVYPQRGEVRGGCSRGVVGAGGRGGGERGVG